MANQLQIDQLVQELQQLVGALKNASTNNGNNGGNNGNNPFNNSGYVRGGRGVKQKDDGKYSTADLLEEVKNLRHNVKKLNKANIEYANLVENSSNVFSGFAKSAKKLNDDLREGGEKFNESAEYYENLAKVTLEQNQLTQDIQTKTHNLRLQEAELIKKRLEIEKAELGAREKYSEEILRAAEENKKVKEALSELEVRLKNIKEDEETARLSVREERKKDVEETAKIEQGNAKKQENIDITHKNAMAKKEETRLMGYNKKGKKNSGAEMFEMFSNMRSYFLENSKGRIFADGVNTATQVGVGAAKMVQSGKMDVSGMADKATQALSKLGPYGAAAGGLVQILKVGFEMFAKVDKAAADYARSVGGGAYNMKKMRLEATELAKEMSKFGKTAYLAEEILARMGEASEAFGRNLEGLSTNDLRSLQDLKNFGVDDQSIAQFDTFGVSVHNVSKQLADLYGESGKRGLNAKATIKAFTSNLKMAQNYTFARGQKALMDMAMKSAQLKFNLRDAEQFANKVSTLEGAMTAGAQLSVLGGNFAMQGNPLAMMYNSLYDVEGLQNQMLAMTKGMAKWNYSTNQLDISAFDRERLKAMAQVSGIDYSDLTSQALNQARVDRVSAQLGNGFSKEEEEYIKNLAALDEKGNAYIRVGDKEYNMSDIKADKDGVRRQLKAQSEAKDTKEGADMGDIWSETRGIQDKLDDYIKWMQSKFMNVIVKIATFFTKEDAHALKYGLEGEQLEQYNTLKKVLDGKNIKQEDINVLSEDLQKILKQNNIIDENGKLNQYTLESMRYSGNKAISWGQTAEMVSKSALMDGTLNKANGGYISGPGGPKDDAIPARLSDGEFVVNAEATARNRPFLEQINNKSNVKNGKNIMNHTTVKGYADGGAVGSSNSTYQQRVDISPIKIEFGTLELRIGDLTRVLNSNEIASKLLNNTTFVDNIVKEIGTRANFGYRKDDATNRCLIDPYVSGY